MINKTLFLYASRTPGHNPLFILLAIFLSGLLLTGCGGESSNSVPNADPVADPNVISGVASKGIIDGGSVRAYAIQENGTRGVELGSALTDANGNYSIDLGDHAGLVIVEVTGGTYTDEATGSIVNNNLLRAIIPSVKGNKKVAITPLTEIAVQIAGSTLTLTKVNNANAAVSVLIGGADITETQPQDINGDLSGATDAEINYTMVLASISQMVENGSVADVDNAIIIIKSDLEDDGVLAIDGSGAGDLLQDALRDFVASDENNTGLTEDDISLDEALVYAAMKFILIKEDRDYESDDVIDEIHTYTYDINDNRTVYEQDGVWDDDILPDNVVNMRETYTYDANSNMTMKERDSNFAEADGVVDSKTTYTYNANGNKTMEELDSNNNGVVNVRITYTYDANGNVTHRQQDNGANGVMNAQVFYTYDADGNRTMVEHDWDGDDVINFRYAYTYDANGNLTESSYLDGNSAAQNRYTYTYDANGNMTMREYDVGPNDVIDEIETYTYDAYGNKTMYEHDWYADGSYVDRITYTWQDAAQP